MNDINAGDCLQLCGTNVKKTQNDPVCSHEETVLPKTSISCFSECPKVTFVQVTKPSSGRRNYDSFLLGTKEEIV